MNIIVGLSSALLVLYIIFSVLDETETKATKKRKGKFLFQKIASISLTQHSDRLSIAVTRDLDVLDEDVVRYSNTDQNVTVIQNNCIFIRILYSFSFNILKSITHRDARVNRINEAQLFLHMRFKSPTFSLYLLSVFLVRFIYFFIFFEFIFNKIMRQYKSCRLLQKFIVKEKLISAGECI